MNLRLSNQAVGAIMLALQKGILEQTDITNMLKEFQLIQTADGLIVDNPPTISLQEENKTEKPVKKTRKKRTTKKRATAKKPKEDA
jgi:hypothetical protein